MPTCVFVVETASPAVAACCLHIEESRNAEGGMRTACSPVLKHNAISLHNVSAICMDEHTW